MYLIIGHDRLMAVEHMEDGSLFPQAEKGHLWMWNYVMIESVQLLGANRESKREGHFGI